MKNIIKKVSAIAMAAVLLSAGGAAAANTKSAKNNTITAHAAFCGAGNHRYNYSYSYSFKQNGRIYCYDVYICGKCGTRNPRLVAVY